MDQPLPRNDSKKPKVHTISIFIPITSLSNNVQVFLRILKIHDHPVIQGSSSQSSNSRSLSFNRKLSGNENSYLNHSTLLFKISLNMDWIKLAWMVLLGINLSQVRAMDLSPIVDLFQDPYCITLLQEDSRLSWDQGVSDKIMLSDLNHEGQTSKFCKAVLVSLELETFMKKLENHSSLFHREDSQYILMVRHNSWRKILGESNFFGKIVNLAVLDLIHGEFYTKALCGTTPYIKIGVYNGNRVVLNGSPVFQKYPDMSCQSIKGTAFHYSPFTTISEDAEGQRSYRGLEARKPFK